MCLLKLPKVTSDLHKAKLDPLLSLCLACTMKQTTDLPHLRVTWGYIGIVDRKIEATIWGFGFKVMLCPDRCGGLGVELWPTSLQRHLEAFAERHLQIQMEDLLQAQPQAGIQLQ